MIVLPHSHITDVTLTKSIPVEYMFYISSPYIQSQKQHTMPLAPWISPFYSHCDDHKNILTIVAIKQLLHVQWRRVLLVLWKRYMNGSSQVKLESFNAVLRHQVCKDISRLCEIGHSIPEGQHLFLVYPGLPAFSGNTIRSIPVGA